MSPYLGHMASARLLDTALLIKHLISGPTRPEYSSDKGACLRPEVEQSSPYCHHIPQPPLALRKPTNRDLPRAVAQLVKALPGMHGALDSIPQCNRNWAWWHAPLSQEDQKFSVILGYSVTPRPTQATYDRLKKKVK